MMYITYDDLYFPGYAGIRKKIMGQVKVFEKNFSRVFLTCYCGRMMYLLNGEQVIDKEQAITKAECNDILLAWIDKYRITRTYIRYRFSDQWFLRFLERQKEKGIRSVMEIPTYPYDGELPFGRVKLEDGYFRRFLYKYVDLVATNFEGDCLWGMKCAQLENGITLESNPLHKKKPEIGRLIMIAVSGMEIWHGYERMIEGMRDYYEKDGSRDLKLKLLGEGPEKKHYITLVEQYGLESHVEFCGKVDGDDLDRQYDLADLAVGSLGLYKTDIQDVTPIKGAEYCARGIPFICGYHDMRFTGEEPFIMNVPNSPEPVDMEQVITFYEKIMAREGYMREMREYAKRHLTWDIVMRPVVDYFHAPGQALVGRGMEK